MNAEMKKIAEEVYKELSQLSDEEFFSIIEGSNRSELSQFLVSEATNLYQPTSEQVEYSKHEESSEYEVLFDTDLLSQNITSILHDKFLINELQSSDYKDIFLGCKNCETTEYEAFTWESEEEWLKAA